MIDRKVTPLPTIAPTSVSDVVGQYSTIGGITFGAALGYVYINASAKLSQHLKVSKILLDTLRTKNNYKYAIHLSEALSLNIPL